MKYTKLFGIRLKHPYYQDGVCTDFAIEPTPSTLRLLANDRCVLKSGPGWARVFIDLDPDKPESLIPIDAGDPFAFRLRLENPDFALITDLPNGPSSKSSRRVYANGVFDASGKFTVDASGKLTLNWRKERRQERFAWGASDVTKCRFKLGGEPLPAPEGDLKVEVEGASQQQLGSDYDKNENAVTITIKAPNVKVKADALVTISYFGKPTPRPGEFATVEIFVDKVHVTNDDGPADLELEFQQQSVLWAYYLVTDLYPFAAGPPAKNPVDDFKIEGRPGVGPSPGLPKFDARDLKDQPDPNDPIADRLADLYPNARRIRLLSAAPVPFQQVARKIQLKVGTKTVEAALPNPAPGQRMSLPKSPPTANACFQIVRCIKP
jgi:hypothetical protein